MDLYSVLSDAWAGSDHDAGLRNALKALSDSDVAVLQRGYEHLVNRARARVALDSGGQVLTGPIVDGPVAVEPLGFLRLVMLSIFQSDSLAFVGPDARLAQLNYWSDITGVPLPIVKEAVSVGPSGWPHLLAHE